MNQITSAAALAVTAVTSLAMATTGSPAAAGTQPLVDLRGVGVGSYVLDTAGTAHLSGSVVGRPFDGAYVATLAADDGSLSGPGSCEPATGTHEVTGSRDRTLRLETVGEVCGEFPDAAAACPITPRPPPQGLLTVPSRSIGPNPLRAAMQRSVM